MLRYLNRLSLLRIPLENNIAHQDSLYKLRAETQAAFDEAKALEKRWKVLEKEQKEVYQVRLLLALRLCSRRTNDYP